MPPPPRYIVHHHTMTGLWLVVDRLVGFVVYSNRSALPVGHRARDEEAEWRARCQRWIEQEEQT